MNKSEIEELEDWKTYNKEQFRMNLSDLFATNNLEKFKIVVENGNTSFDWNKENDFFQNACRYEQIHFIEYLLEKNKVTNIVFIQKGLMALSDRANPFIKKVIDYYLLLPKKLEIKEKFLNKLFLNACKCKDINLIEYLLYSKKFKIDIKTENSRAFFLACTNPPHFELIKLLSSDPKLEKHVDVTARNSIGLTELFVTSEGLSNLPIIEYLLFSPELKIKPDIYAQNNSCLKNAVYRENEELIDWLIFNYKLESTDDVTHNIKIDTILECAEKVKKKFAIRELNKKLENNLLVNVKFKKVKI